jgi:transcriptional regulator with XRE-family HTH domain
MTVKTIGEIIRTIRVSRGITATFMSRQLGYKAVSSYLRLEKGESPVTLEQAKIIADLLTVEVAEFFNEKNLRESHNTTYYSLKG